MGRRPRRTFRGLIGSSLALRPTCSRDLRCGPLRRRLRRFRYLHHRSDCYRLERPSCRVGVALTEDLHLFTAHCPPFPRGQCGRRYRRRLQEGSPGVFALKVREFARRRGLSVRTQHHYDAIGLPNPSLHTEVGYRFYTAFDIARRKLVSVPAESCAIGIRPRGGSRIKPRRLASDRRFASNTC
jgi:hypothetical protein